MIKHRINTIEELKKTPQSFGVEMDLHAYGSKLVVHHDPKCSGVLFEDWLSHYNHTFCILNIKEEGIEQEVVEMMESKGISDYFLLDVTFPFMMKLAQKKIHKQAVRLSKYESIQTVLAMKSLVEWVWIDLFEDELPLNQAEVHTLKDAGFRLCLVSPELHGRLGRVTHIQKKMDAIGLKPDAICTKDEKQWIV